MLMNTHSTSDLKINRIKLAGLVAAMIVSLLMPLGSAGATPSKAFSQISFIPNIETAGVVVTGTGLPASAQLAYRRAGETNWRAAHNLVRIKDGRLVGSLFNLSPASSYEVKVTDGTGEITGSFTTQADELLFTPTNVIYVNDDAPAGGDGSFAAPFRTIQEAVNRAAPGTQVLVADGVYKESVTFPASGMPGAWIQVRAEGGGAILDGSEVMASDVWSPYEGRSAVWSTKLGYWIKYLARDGKRMYQYDDLNGLIDGRGHNGVPMSEGWYYDPTTGKLYVRTQREPHKYTWNLPRFNRAFYVDGRDWIWIEGFEMRFYGTGYGCGACLKDASHIVVRKNRIHNMQNPVFVEWNGSEGRGDDTRIEYNEMYDVLDSSWSWNAQKGTSMESIAVVLRGHNGAIVRGNTIHHYFNGIYTSSSGALDNPGVMFDADIYNNRIYAIGDDAFEPEGTCVNHRFRNNTIDSALVGISLAPITMGPVWVLRNTFANFTGRSVKWDRNSDGWVFMYHNTSWTNFSAPNALEFISPVRNSVLRNNIFQGGVYSVEARNPGAFGHDWNYDNWSTGFGSRFKWEGVDYPNINQFCRASGLECNGHESAPGLTYPAGGDFSLLPTSANIDRGLFIPGINDGFYGGAPDIGAIESFIVTTPSVSSIARADVNPTGASIVNFNVTFSKAVNGVDITDFVLAVDASITGAAILSVTPISELNYIVSVNTGSGNGNLRLDLPDDDSIRDANGTPLGGVGAGNGGFNGDTYSIDKTLPFASSILRLDASPSNAELIHFTVNFTENVTGVDAGDFILTPSGSISNYAIAEVLGSGNSYTVTVNTGVGDGTLRLDLADNDSILDETSLPLGGVGAGNGNYSSGDVYVINKLVPSVTSILRVDPSPTAAGSVRFTVNFSESVSGVDAADFALTVSGVSDAGVASVSGSGTFYTVTVFTGNGNGTLRLDLLDNDTILDAGLSPLGGAGLGNANFYNGETYTIDRAAPLIQTSTFYSDGAHDGWILEGKETSNKGGTMNGNASVLRLGDNSQDSQYRSILHFNTSTLPDNAVITQAILTLQLETIVGTNPFSTHRFIWVDIRQGAFGSFGPLQIGALQTSDFQAPASMYTAGTILDNAVGGWYWTNLDAKALPFINLKGATQFRLGFLLDDDDDRQDDYLSFFSGNYGVTTARPQLTVKYYVP
jgi:hypothetical protein